MTHMDFLGFSFLHIVTSISLSNIFLGNRVWIIPVHWVQKIGMHLDSARWISLKTQETTNYSGLQPRHNANLVNIGTLRSTKSWQSIMLWAFSEILAQSKVQFSQKCCSIVKFHSTKFAKNRETQNRAEFPTDACVHRFEVKLAQIIFLLAFPVFPLGGA